MIGSRAEYEAMYRRSMDDPDAFWGELAEEFDWKTKVRALSLRGGGRGFWRRQARARCSGARSLPRPFAPLCGAEGARACLVSHKKG